MSIPADGRRAGGAEEGAERGLAPEVVQQLVQAVPLVGRDLVPKVRIKWFEFASSRHWNQSLLLFKDCTESSR